MPLVTISGLLLLIPGTGGLVAILTGLVFLLFLYRMVLHGLTIMAAHGLSGERATLIVLIVPMLFFLIALLFVLLVGGEWFGMVLEGFGWVSEGRGKRKKVVK